MGAFNLGSFERVQSEEVRNRLIGLEVVENKVVSSPPGIIKKEHRGHMVGS
jgi:hypothetical protein